MNIAKLYFLQIIIIVLLTSETLAEDDHLRTHVGIGLGGSTHGITTDVHLTQRYNRITASFRYIHTEDEFLAIFPESDISNFDELGILVGYSFSRKRILFTTEIGLSLTKGECFHVETDTTDRFTSKYESVIGFAFGSQVCIKLSKHFGIGAYPYINLNEHKNYAGVNFEFFIGQIR